MHAILTCLRVEHDPTLLLLAALVCVIGVYGSFSVARHAGRSEGEARRRWGAIAILAAGSTAWATHMVALLAFRPGMPSGFEPFLTALSLLLAVAGIAAGVGMALGSRSRRRRFLGGLVIGAGVAALHYVGQAAYFVRGEARWDYALVAFSILAGLPLFGLSLMVSGERNKTVRLLGAPLLVLSIAVLHLGGMTALQLQYDPRIQLPRLAIAPETLAPIVAAVCLALLTVAVVGLRLTLSAKAALLRERKQLGELANLALEGLAICEDDRVVTANDSLARLCGVPRGALTGRTVASLVRGVDVLALSQSEEADADLLTSLGGTLPVRVIRSDVRLGGRPQMVIAFRDQRERLKSEERIRKLAFSDPLTGLANRTRFHDALAEQVARQAETDLPFTLLMLDLDGFKSVNDSLGHSGGDDVLRIAADRLRAAVDDRHLVARLGGDEFAILVRDSADPLQAGEIGRRVIASLEMPIRVQQQMVHVSASIGVMPSQWPPLSAGDMLTAADLALYDAKANGRATVRLFTPELRRVSMARSGLANDLQAAWTENQFELYYQPQVDLFSGEVLGAEALIRWNHAKTGLVAPGAFLPVLESSHLAVPVGDWILQMACRQARSFRAAGLGDVRIGINLFAAQLRSPDFVERVEEALRASGLAASQLELEITENIVLLNERLIANHLRRIRAMGIGIAFDDFGTGYASLTMLKKLDITRLKIDRSFVSEIETSRKDQGIVDAVIRMAEGCDLSVIAEGIEKQSQADFLRGKVGEGQGYLFGKPKPADRFVQTFGQAPLSPERAMTPEQGVRKRAG